MSENKPVALPLTNDDRPPQTQEPAVAADTTPAPTNTARTEEPVAQSPAAIPQTLAERIAATEEWLNSTPVTHYFIQLLSTDGNNEHGVEIFIDNVSKSLDPTQIRVYRSTLSGRERLGVIYGDFPTRDLALAELAKLAPTGEGRNPAHSDRQQLRP